MKSMKFDDCVVDGRLALRGPIEAEHSDDLRDILLAQPELRIDLGGCEAIHSAAVQVLMAAKRPIVAWPTSPSLAEVLRLALAADGATPAAP